ncbi:MAG: hypothetical protein CVU24_10280 [Betaproteobacteria bacterium HGW-Betaproteobacteria-18]|nr:MAG: hypothetical protein CVU24_10280 [Betaproteobacteria bacterium HGW-Betaproteobacteria-18]
MFEFFRFGRAKEPLKSKVMVEPASDQPKKSDLRREMIRLALKSVLRRYGIPFQWIGCEVVPMARSGDSQLMLIQLVLRKWHEGLMSYAPELQNQLLNEIQFFDSNAEAANFLFVWKFAPDCGYPNGQLPEPGFWGPAIDSTPGEQGLPVKSSIDAAIKAVPTAKFDLPKSKLDDEDRVDGFAATQIFDNQ